MKIRRMLIVEEEPDLANWLTAYFSEHGYQVWNVRTREEALDIARKVAPEIIVRNVSTPIYAVKDDPITSAVRKFMRTSYIPVIFLIPGYDWATRYSNGIRENFWTIDDETIKPIDMEELHLRVDNSLQQVQRMGVVDGLPNLKLISDYLGDVIHAKYENNWTYINLKLHHLDGFQARFGERPKQVLIHFLRLIIAEALDKYGTADDMLAYVSDGNFLVLTFSSTIQQLQQHIVDWFSKPTQMYSPLSISKGEGSAQTYSTSSVKPNIYMGSVDSKVDKLDSAELITSLALERRNEAEESV